MRRGNDSCSVWKSKSDFKKLCSSGSVMESGMAIDGVVTADSSSIMVWWTMDDDDDGVFRSRVVVFEGVVVVVVGCELALTNAVLLAIDRGGGGIGVVTEWGNSVRGVSVFGLGSCDCDGSSLLIFFLSLCCSFVLKC